MEYSREEINRLEEKYKLPCDGKVRNAIATLIDKVEVAKEKGCKVSKESQEAVEVLNQLMKADGHPFGGWAIFRP